MQGGFSLAQTLRRPPVWALLLIFAAIAVSGYVPITVAVLPGLIAYLFAAGKPWQMALPLILGAIGLVLLNGWETAAYLAGMLLPTAVVLGVWLRHGKGAYMDMAMAAAALISLGIYAYVCLPSLIATGNAFYAVQQVFYGTRDAAAEMGANALGLTDAQLALMNGSLEEAARAVPNILTAVICTAGSLCGLFSFLVAQKLCFKAGLPLRRMTKFTLWRLNPGSIIGFAILVAGCIVLALIGVEWITAVWITVLAVILIPLLIQGLSTVLFFLSSNRMNPFLYVLFFLLVLFFLPYTLIILAFLGIFEQAFRLRSRFTGTNGPGKD